MKQKNLKQEENPVMEFSNFDNDGSFKSFEKSVKDAGVISIKPLLINGKENFGLEKYNMVIFPNAFYKEDLSCIEFNGVYRYVSGLDEYAPEIQNMEDETQKKIAIKRIRNIVSYLERILASNNVDPDDDKFWEKVKKIRPDNDDFWSKVKLEISNKGKILQPMKDPNDLILMLAIEAGGFSMVAKSYEDAISKPVLPKFYLDKRYITASAKTGVKKTRNRAIAKLDELFENNYNKVFYIAKILDLSTNGFKKSTPHDIVYDFLDEYISGNSYESSKTKAPEDFLKLTELEVDQLLVRALVKDAVLYHVIAAKPDGSMYYIKKNAFVGKSNVDAAAYMLNPQNADIYNDVLADVEKIWQ